MAQGYVVIPNKMPSEDQATLLFHRFMNTQHKHFLGKKPIELFSLSKPGPEPMRAWMVGSVVWRPAVIGKMPEATADLDIVFADAGSAEMMANNVCAWLAENDKAVRDTNSLKYEVVPTSDGSGKKVTRSWKAGNNKEMYVKVMDCWDLDEGFTIAERISCYQRDHERVAMIATTGPGDIGGLTRLVKPQLWNHLQRNKPMVAKQYPDGHGGYDPFGSS